MEFRVIETDDDYTVVSVRTDGAVFTREVTREPAGPAGKREYAFWRVEGVRGIHPYATALGEAIRALRVAAADS